MLCIQIGDKNFIVIKYLGLKRKIRHRAIVENIVAYVYAKFRNDRWWNGKKTLADRKSDNNNKKKNNVGGA